MLKKHLLLIFFVSIISCQNKPIGKEKQITKKHVLYVKKTIPKIIDIHDCTTAEDTICSDGDWVKYIHLKDDQYGVEIKFGAITDTLAYTFNCNTVNGLIPKLFMKNKELILTQGSGFTYRNIIVCSNKSNKLEISEFESNRVYPESDNYLVFETEGRLCFYNQQNKRKFYKSIPDDCKGLKVLESLIFKKEIVVSFETNKEFKVTLPKS